jgi:hypothetical protein
MAVLRHQRHEPSAGARLTQLKQEACARIHVTRVECMPLPPSWPYSRAKSRQNAMRRKSLLVRPGFSGTVEVMGRTKTRKAPVLDAVPGCRR